MPRQPVTALALTPAPVAPATRDPAWSALGPGQLHEIHAGAVDWAAALAFALGAAAGEGPVVLVRGARRGAWPLDPCAAGLAELGIDPARLLIIAAPDAKALLRAGHEAARCPGLAALVLESWGALPAYDLTASRRLVLAAEASGVPVVMLRLEAQPRPSAAHSRWSIRAGPSVAPPSPLAIAPPGPAMLALDLLRRRGGPAQPPCNLAWDEDDGAFRPAPPPAPARTGRTAPPLSGAVVSLGTQRVGAESRLWQANPWSGLDASPARSPGG
jgi:protein ImuA